MYYKDVHVYTCTYIYIKSKVRYMKSIHFKISPSMCEQLDEIAKRENKPRSFVMREILHKGIEERNEQQRKSNVK